MGREPDYDPMPNHRIHDCHNVNAAGVPVAWVIYDKHGPQIETTDVYGNGTIMPVNYCPWCGEVLATPERMAKLGLTNHENIIIAGR